MSIVKDAVVAIAAAFGAVFAGMGLKAWKRQLTGKTDYELARGILRRALEVRRAIEEARDPSITGGEIEAAKEHLKTEGIADQRAAGTVAAYNVRYGKVVTAWFQLYEKMIEAEVSWGVSVKAAKDPLEACVKELRHAIWSHNDMITGRRRNPTPDQMQKADDVVYSLKDEDRDGFARKVNEAVKVIEDLVRPHIKP